MNHLSLKLTHLKTSLVQSLKVFKSCVLLFDHEKELKEDFDRTIKMIYEIYDDRIKNIEKFKLENDYVKLEKFASKRIKENNSRYRKQYLNGKFVFSDLDSTLWYLHNIENYIFNKKIQDILIITHF